MTSEFTIATHALVYLNHKKESQSSEQLAENICTNPARVRKVMAKLKKAGLVSAREGAIGGYRFEREAADITLLDILHALDECVVTPGWRSGNADLPCLIASGMADVMDGVYARLDTACEKELSAVAVADIDRQLFGPDAARKGNAPLQK